MTIALVTGITGQDGSLLAEALIAEGTHVVGVTRSATDPHAVSNLALVADHVELRHADLLQPSTLRSVIAEAAPDEIYHLAAPTFVPASWEDPEGTMAAIAEATAAVLAAAGDARVVVAASSEVFGDAGESPQSETSPMRPRTPYGVAKLAALGLVRVYRARGTHASAAITFNHESERRPERFVTRKVTKAAAAIKRELQDELVLGDLEAVRDWSAARDVVAGYIAMARAEDADDYVLASGKPHTVGDLVETAFRLADLDPADHVRIDSGFTRAPEATPPVGDPSKARERLGWQARLGFEDLISEMLAADLERLGSVPRA